jgi:hypothetical protein
MLPRAQNVTVEQNAMHLAQLLFVVVLFASSSAGKRVLIGDLCFNKFLWVTTRRCLVLTTPHIARMLMLPLQLDHVTLLAVFAVL